MRPFLLSLCVAALLAGCSDDDTKGGGTAPAVTEAQFAAAVDDFVPETRASVAGGVTTWQTGDRIGITALIDGTPYVMNVPYEFTEATTFGYLTAAGDPILWNEAVVGQRSFFAIWPWKESDGDFEELDRAQFGFEVPAVQEVTEGVNNAVPVLVGSGVTDALTERPVALRFRSLFSVLNLSFGEFAETSLERIVIEPAAEAEFDGYLAGAGVVASTGRMTLAASAPRIEVTCTGSGLDIARGASVQVPVGRFTVRGGLKFTVTTTDERTFSYTAFADEQWRSYAADEAGDFAGAKFVSLTIPLKVVSDETTEVFFEDDFDWIANSTRWDKSNTGGGWPTVTTASPTGKANYFTLDLLKGTATDPEDGFVRKGYVQSEQRTAVQARYEGYVCLGTTSAQGALITPALEAVGNEPTDLLVSFYGATYASESLQADGKPLMVKVLNAGTIGDGEATETEVEMTNYFGWRKYWVIVRGATSATQIQLGKDVKQSVGRVLVDNLLIGRAVKGATAGEREVQVTQEPYIKVLEGEEGAAVENAAGAQAWCIVQSNLPWSASTQADWVLISPTVEYNGTGIAYAVTVTARTLNQTGADRTAEVVFTAGDLSRSVVFTQTGEIPEVIYFEDDFSWCKGDGTTGDIFDLESGGSSIGSGGTQYKNWSAAYKATGWTATMATNSPVTRNGTLMCGGTTSAAADVVSPAFEAIGAGTADIRVEYDVLEYKNASETGKSVLTVLNGGVIESYAGNYTDVAGDTFTGLNDDKTSLNYYCGNYKTWPESNRPRWHHIEVVIRNATSRTQIQLAGYAPYSRFWLDNFKVTPAK
ncbi:hypothetical protein [Alistipes sp.]|uniref:hypothetical protein n=1 Tax=Alistipes sp. TaxID=1872444 RepID=UPI003AEF4C27